MEIEEARQELHHQAQIRSKDKEKMAALGGLPAECRKARRKYTAHMIHINNAIAILASENKVHTY